MIRKRKYYAVFKGKEYYLDTTWTKLITYSKEDAVYGFKLNPGTSEKYIRFFDLHEIENAYQLENWAEFNGKALKIGNYVNNKFSLYTTEENVARFFNLKYDSYMGFYEALWKSDKEISSIWENRLPINGFPFNTNKIVLLKKDGVWLQIQTASPTSPSL